MNNKTLIYVILVLLSLCILIGMIWCVQNYPKEVIKTDTIEKVEFKWKDTVIKDTIVKPKYIEVIKRDTVYDSKGNEIELVKENKIYQDTIVCEKDTAEVEIYISGVETSLDSLKMRFKTHTEIRTVEVTKYIAKKRKLFELKPQITTGYDPFHKDFGVVIGVGIGINL